MFLRRKDLPRSLRKQVNRAGQGADFLGFHSTYPFSKQVVSQDSSALPLAAG